MKSYLIEDRYALADWFTKISGMSGKVFPMTLQVYKGKNKHRSLLQNDLTHVWYQDIADQSEGSTPLEVKRECKLNCGVPILRAESESFRREYDRIVSGHSYETQLEMMDLLPVTSIMSMRQMTDYIDAVFHTYTAAGFYLELPEER